MQSESERAEKMDQDYYNSAEIYENYVSSDLTRHTEAIRQLRDECSHAVTRDFMNSPVFDEAFEEICRDITDLIQNKKLSSEDFVETFTIVMAAKSHDLF